AAVSWAGHIAATSAFAGQSDVRTLAAVQVMTVAVLAISVNLLLRRLGFEINPNPIDWRFSLQIGYLALMVTFVSALLQTWAQGKVPATHAAVYYALEPATAAVFAYLLFRERLSPGRGFGAVLIVTGVMISRLKVASRLSHLKLLSSYRKSIAGDRDLRQ
ncbi:MAG: DMT family transporter, partial [Blastocatellia bacterium]|nr:DMT family transporter [Blastocatellia bacterium]